MKLIGGALNGNHLREILENAPQEVEWVKAAIAYAHGSPALIDFCVERKLRLQFWGRLDESIPVALPILERFLKLGKNHTNYTCKLVWKHYHPKIIQFGGYGVYIGSANLTDAAWNKNIECGIFMTEDELTSSGFGVELDDIFDQIDDIALPLTEELLGQIRNFERLHFFSASDLKKAESQTARDFESTVGSVVSSKFAGLSVVTKKSAVQRRHEVFLKEWNDTLQLLRQIQTQVTTDQNRPDWISKEVPAGVQVDQFLHGFYYRQVMDGNRSQHEDFYMRNRSKPQAALEQAMSWWKDFKEVEFERKMVEVHAPQLLKSLARTHVLKLTREEWIDVCKGVNAFRTAARQISNATVGLKVNSKMNIDARVEHVADWIYDQHSGNESSILQIIHRVLYGGSLDEVPMRLWEAVFTDDWHVPSLGLSCLGEIIGWAMPERFPPRNGRTSKALRALGFNVKVYTE